MRYGSPAAGALPPIVKNLLIINGLMLLLKIVMGLDVFGRSNLDNILGLHVLGSPDFKPWQVLTHMFMHAGPGSGGQDWFFHIASNMFALYMFGPPIERVMGPKRFLTYYLVCGLGAAALQMGFSYMEVAQHVQQLTQAGVDLMDVKRMVIAARGSVDDANVVLNEIIRAHPGTSEIAQQVFQDYIGVMVGASGAIFGLLLAFAMLFPNTELMLLFLPIPIKAKYFVILYGLWELYAGVRQSTGDNVAHYAHLGGLLFGLILILHWRRQRIL